MGRREYPPIYNSNPNHTITPSLALTTLASTPSLTISSTTTLATTTTTLATTTTTLATTTTTTACVVSGENQVVFVEYNHRTSIVQRHVDCFWRESTIPPLISGDA
ncbi:hypothetical protein QVD17_16207 [Tagetes erecta]|uniref:Uncharacterized protein n=1 Tax=Tagetes erecta TaxID=13708 RepID=A0AAD8KQI3_TARER|nr:hypothetical protein QVD17_16207 [Tagetes erecta]